MTNLKTISLTALVLLCLLALGFWRYVQAANEWLEDWEYG